MVRKQADHPGASSGNPLEQDRDRRKSGATRSRAPAVVVIAASAGGIPALMTVLEQLPGDFRAPIVIVQHRAATKRSMLPAILARAARLPVRDAVDGEPMAPGTIYVAPPDRHLRITPDGRFETSDGGRIRHVLSSANPLFETAAGTFGPRVIAVVLSGSGMDGTDGVQAVKVHGGTVIAQDHWTSEQFGMPGAAIRSGAVDFVLPLGEIGPALAALVSDRPLTTRSAETA